MKEMKNIHLEILHSSPESKSKLRFKEVRPFEVQQSGLRIRLIRDNHFDVA